MNTAEPGWHYPSVRPDGVQGRGLAEDNFAQEDRTSQEILIREALQNPCDAPSRTGQGPVEVHLRVVGPDQVDKEYLRQLLDAEYVARLDASMGEAVGLDFQCARLLIVEDFGTTGLLGSYSDSSCDGASENWNAFWFREGEGAKAGFGSNGRAGQGKVTYYRNSSARAVFGLTVRETDSVRLLMGRSSLRRTYLRNKTKYERDSFWCMTEDDARVLPITDMDRLEKFARSFGLERTTEPSLSIVIPFPKEFSETEALVTVIAEYYYPIVTERLSVTVGSTHLNSTNIDELADRLLPDEAAKHRGSSFTKAFRQFVRRAAEEQRAGIVPILLKSGWDKQANLMAENFPEGALNALKSSLEKGEKVAVRCPVKIRARKAGAVESWFDVHLQVPDELERYEEAYIRRDLLVGSEKHLASGAVLQRARGLALIQDAGISAFLADAEEPTHLKWNASRPRLAEDYQSPKDIVRAVRQALPRLLTFLSGGLNKRDLRALAKYFNKKVDNGRSFANGRNRRKEDEHTNGIEDLPPPATRKQLRLTTGDNWISVSPNGSAGPCWGDLPIRSTLEAAYEGLDLDPFEGYDPFDFDFEDRKLFPLEAYGLEIHSALNNKIDFEIQQPDFSLKIHGFDKNVRLRARLTYSAMKTEDHETVVDHQ